MYVEQSVLTAAPEKIVVLLFQSCLASLDQATRMIERKASSGPVGEPLGRAFAIVSELKASLDLERGGELAARLQGLYLFVQKCINQAISRREVQPLLEARQILNQLKEGFDGILKSA